MPFLPNAVDAEDVSQAQIDSRDFAIILAGFAGTGVISGCAVTAQATPNMTVAIAAGTVAVAGTSVAVTGGNVTITTADSTNPRFDLVCVDNAGTKSVIAGTAAVAPVFPDPGSRAVLAAVRVPAGATSINNQKITDKRVVPVVSQPAEATGTIKPFAGSAAPGGWQLCDGSAISRTTFSALYAVVGTTYGVGDGSTTFNVPDAKGRNLVGLGSHTDVNALGKNDGLAAASRTPKHGHTNGLSLPNHGHNISDPGHSHGGVIRSGSTIQGDAGAANMVSGNTDAAVTNITVGNPTSNPAINGTIGVSGGLTDTAPFLVVNYIIKL